MTMHSLTLDWRSYLETHWKRILGHLKPYAARKYVEVSKGNNVFNCNSWEPFRQAKGIRARQARWPSDPVPTITSVVVMP